MKTRKSDCHHEMILPDRYTTRLSTPEDMTITGTGQESEWLTGGGIQSVARPWLHVGIVSDDFIAVTALRWLLVPLCPVRLRVWRTAEEAQEFVLMANRFRPDILIWTDGGQRRPESIRSITILSRRCPWLRQLFLSDHVPPSLGKLLRGVYIASEKHRPGELIRLLEASAYEKLEGRPFLNGTALTPGQWSLLHQRMAGYTIQEIAEKMQIKPKTLSSRYRNLMLQLHIRTRVEQTWFFRHLPQVLAAAPGITRLRQPRLTRTRQSC